MTAPALFESGSTSYYARGFRLGYYSLRGTYLAGSGWLGDPTDSGSGEAERAAFWQGYRAGMHEARKTGGGAA